MSDTPKKKGWFQRLKAGLSRSKSAISGGIGSIFTKRKLDATTLEELEDLLITSDLGVEVSMRICENLAQNRYDKEISPEEVEEVLATEITAFWNLWPSR